jgi:hypothetical protein
LFASFISGVVLFVSPLLCSLANNPPLFLFFLQGRACYCALLGVVVAPVFTLFFFSVFFVLAFCVDVDLNSEVNAIPLPLL